MTRRRTRSRRRGLRHGKSRRSTRRSYRRGGMNQLMDLTIGVTKVGVTAGVGMGLMNMASQIGK